MIPFTLEILDTKSGEKRQVSPAMGWNENCPALFRERMCDCFAGGFFEQAQTGLAHVNSAYTWKQRNGCDHKAPSKRFVVLRATLTDGGDVIELSREAA
jgi:hypothetical protein